MSASAKGRSLALRESISTDGVPLKRRKITHWIGRNWARIVYSHQVEPVWLETNVFELPIPHLDERLDGVSILHLTDFHLGDRVAKRHIRQAVDLGQQQACDLIALTGDFVQGGFRHVDPVAEMLSKLSAPLGVYAVLGNHDYAVRNASGLRLHRGLAERVRKSLEDYGIPVLHNEHRIVAKEGAPLAVAGVADLWSREADLRQALAGLDSETPRVVLAHNPTTIEQLETLRCDLMLSGHTHGGQIDVPGWGRPMLSRKMKGYAAGLYYHQGGFLYVNKGIGYTVRFRFRVRPEVAVMRLVRANLGAL
ncbi:putative metallophosphoesterase [Planctomycetes bacterium Pan216]|uniref:Putative metallophosphoesterase n=1 Tax=Kolteria novifilia TaxID=2527975 RepID=A0A518B9Y0_9BACT|nr:putative metallophosphoesterase [Planctomycetes bacterium Pan216]